MRLLILALTLLAFGAQAATPTFGDFSSNQFRTNGNKVWVKPTPLLTNIYNDGNMMVRGNSTNTGVVNAGVFETDDENSSIKGTSGRLEISVGTSAVTVFGSAGIGTGHILAQDYSSDGSVYTRMPTNSPSDGQVITAAGAAGYTKWAAGGGGGGAPGGSDTQIQFNDGGSFGGDAGFVYNKTTDSVTVTGAIVAASGRAGVTSAGRFYSNPNTPDAGVGNFVAGDASLTLSNNANYNALVGGAANTIYSNAGGGFRAEFNAIVGGQLNVMEDSVDHSFIGGGSDNRVRGASGYVTIFGQSNLSGTNNGIVTILGLSNIIGDNSESASILSGLENVIQTNSTSGDSYGATIVGGYRNTILAGADYSTVLGGVENVSGGEKTMSAGSRADATNDYSFVWADGPDSRFGSTGTNQFLIAARGGVGINTNNPGSKSLSVHGASQFVGHTDMAGHMSATNNNVISPLLGTTSADDAPAGTYGQFLTNTLASGSAVSLTTTTTANITSISLTAGDWMVFGTGAFNPDTTTTVTYTKTGISTTSATFGGQGSFATAPMAVVDNSEDVVMATPMVHVNVSTTTTVYLVSAAAFAASTMTGYGQIIAWRVR